MPTKLHIGNLPDNCSEPTLRDLFSPYGNITDLVIIKNYAFITFNEENDANKALKDLNGAKLLGKSMAVSVSKAKGPKDKEKNDSARNKTFEKRSDNNNRNRQRNNFNNPPPRVLENFNNPPPRVLENIQPNLANLLGQPALGDLGILSAVSTLAAVAEKQRSLSQMNMNSFSGPNSDDRVRQDISNVSQSNSNSREFDPNNDGYVIYERYYVDPKHPLLKGLPLPQLDNLNSMQTSLSPKYPTENHSARDVNPYPTKRNNRNNFPQNSSLSGIDGYNKNYR